MKRFFMLLSCALPWSLRRRFLIAFFHFEIHPTARIGLSWVFPGKLLMEEGASIGHLTVVIHLDLVHLARHSRIGRGNWITGFPSGTGSAYFSHQPERRSELRMGEHSAMTNRHLIDCTSPVRIGKFTTLAGFSTQILTHSIDLQLSRQSSASVTIGDYCFIGTDCVLLGGSGLPDYAVLGAKSLLNKVHEERYTLYGGVPARALQEVPASAAYFTRPVGMV